MNKSYLAIGLLFLLVLFFAVALIASPGFATWIRDSIVYWGGKGGAFFVSSWDGIMANPFYQKWHPLIWIGATTGIILLIVKAVWPRAPQAVKKLPGLSSLGTHSTAAREEPRDIVVTESATPIKTEEAKKEIV